MMTPTRKGRRDVGTARSRAPVPPLLLHVKIVCRRRKKEPRWGSFFDFKIFLKYTNYIVHQILNVLAQDIL